MVLQNGIKNDAWLLLRTGDENALLELYNQHYPGLINFGIKMTGDRAFSNDCITQMLIELWDKRAGLPAVENVRAYLLTCLKHKILFEIKAEQLRNSRLHSIQLFMEDTELSYEEYLIYGQSDKALQEKLAAALAQLTARQKELLKMRFFDDMDYDEISRYCHITRRTAYNIIHDALKSLRTSLYSKENADCVPDNVLL